MDSVSASSGSPPSHLLNGVNGSNGYHHPSVPMNQLREMLTTSDTEHSSDHHDHHDDHDDHDSHHDSHHEDHDDLHPHHDEDDVKDLSLRSSNVGELAQQAPVITSTATAIHLVSDSASNHDFDSSASRSSSIHLHDQSSQSPLPRSSSEELRSVRMRKLSDTSTSCHHDIEHNTVNSYKFKNYIQQRFSHENNHHDENSSVVTDAGHKSPSSSPIDDALLIPRKKPKLCLDDEYEHNSCDGENKPIVGSIAIGECKPYVSSFPMFKTVVGTPSVPSSTMLPNNPSLGSQSVPVFALHSHGCFYVPLSVDYEALVPYLGGINLLESKPFIGNVTGGVPSIPPLHSININVNFATPLANGGRLKGNSSCSVVVSPHAMTASNSNGMGAAGSQSRTALVGVKNCW